MWPASEHPRWGGRVCSYGGEASVLDAPSSQLVLLAIPLGFLSTCMAVRRLPSLTASQQREEQTERSEPPRCNLEPASTAPVQSRPHRPSTMTPAAPSVTPVAVNGLR